MHAAFGEGVVTGVEPGGVIVVRFADDGSERKLMAEYAQVSHATLESAARCPPRSSTARRSPPACGARSRARSRRSPRRRAVRPGLATVLVGEDPASAVYVGGKQRACAEVGMVPFDRRLAADASFEEVAEELRSLNADAAVSGVLLQLPLPGHLDGAALTAMIDPEKDVDGLTPVNAGLLALGLPGLRPCTPSGVMELLAERRHAAGGRRGGRDRALEPVRQADGAAAARARTRR